MVRKLWMLPVLLLLTTSVFAQQNIPKDDVKARERYEKAAATGDAVAMRNILRNQEQETVPKL